MFSSMSRRRGMGSLLRICWNIESGVDKNELLDTMKNIKGAGRDRSIEKGEKIERKLLQIDMRC